MSYVPDQGATPSGPNFVALLSQRDLGLQIPVNFINVPGVVLTPACFGNGTYEDGAATKCFSNLLALGFRRFYLDLYWDFTRGLWSFCPVQLGNANALLAIPTSTQLPVSQTSSAVLSSDQLSTQPDKRADVTSWSSPCDDQILEREDSRSLSSLTSETSSTPGLSAPSVSTTATLTAASNSSRIATAASSSAPNPTLLPNTLVQVGSYACTSSTNFDLFTHVLAAHLQSTETDLNATTKYIILNIHSAANASNPAGPASQPSASAFPQSENLLSSIITTNLSIYLYTPTELSQQRASLNASGSWHGVLPSEQPDEAYFQINNTGGHSFTSDGWPSESFIEKGYAKRLLAGFGVVDPEMREYNFSGDSSSIFPPAYIENPRQVTLSGTMVNTGCIFESGVEMLSAVNSSWATFGMTSSSPASAAEASYGAGNLTDCGISPILNETLEGVSADQNFAPYQDYVLSTIWQWEMVEPRNDSSSAQSSTIEDVRCAALNSTSGRWQAVDCNGGHYAACRIAGLPYRWQISSSKASYTNVNSACQLNTSFDVPRTALENQYLLSAWRQYSSQNEPDDSLLWVNFNDLDVNTCWVIGQNSTCPYLAQPQSQERQVVVPTVAAVLVFVLAGLTVFVKCAANRQSSKRRRRRRGDDGWDYEGVPS